jgi:hypothetical protein
MKGKTPTSIESTADRCDDDLESQESAHAIQHWAVFVVDTMNPDCMDRWEKLILAPGTVDQVGTTYSSKPPRGLQCRWVQRGKNVGTPEEN